MKKGFGRNFIGARAGSYGTGGATPCLPGHAPHAAGWGGEAQGWVEKGKTKKAWTKPDSEKVALLFSDEPETDVSRAKRLRDHLAFLAENADRQETQIAATVAWLNRVEGLPIARNLNVNADGNEKIDVIRRVIVDPTSTE
jgi:hypothetical protein